MAQVIHNINKGKYLYEHKREGSKVRCYYIGSVTSKNGKTMICPKDGKPYEYNKQLNAAIKDEKNAVPEYNKLKKSTSSKKDKKTISKIIKDEKRHRKELESIKRQKSAMEHKNVLGDGAKKRKYAGLTAKEKFNVVMKEYYRGTLHSSNGKIVKKKSQAESIAYSEARHIDPKYGKKNKITQHSKVSTIKNKKKIEFLTGTKYVDGPISKEHAGNIYKSRADENIEMNLWNKTGVYYRVKGSKEIKPVTLEQAKSYGWTTKQEDYDKNYKEDKKYEFRRKDDKNRPDEYKGKLLRIDGKGKEISYKEASNRIKTGKTDIWVDSDRLKNKDERKEFLKSKK